MKYTIEIEINKPVDRVIELFDDADNLPKWMQGLESFTHLSGTPGQPGAKSRLIFKSGGRKMEMIETVTVRNLPYEFSGTYEMPGVLNIMKNSFISLPGNKTRYVTEMEFRFKGAIMKLIAFLMPGMFKKQTRKHLENFKKFAESQN